MGEVGNGCWRHPVSTAKGAHGASVTQEHSTCCRVGAMYEGLARATSDSV